jgi:serine protease Do
MLKGTFYARRSMAAAMLALALGVGGLVGAWAATRTGTTVFGAPRFAFAKSDGENAISLGMFTNGFAAVVKPALPAVVNISSSKLVKTDNGNASLFFNDPFFRQFFGNQFGQNFGGPQMQRERSLGSGVIVSSDGYILTNNHVVDGATDIKVFLNDKREYQAKVIGTDQKTDVAVLKINATGLATLPLGNSGQMQIGDIVFAIGDPFGQLPGTVTMGIVSATGRSGLGIEGYEDFIQTDAAINPGNSGGAMVNLHGELVGINTAIMTGTGGNMGVGFAIPINLARHVMEQIVNHGKVIRGYMGVYIQNVTPELQKAMNLPADQGALVADVTAGGPASKAGIEKGDVILAIDGQKVEDINQLTLRVTDTAPGTAVHLQVFRDGKTRDVNLTLGELPEKNEQTATNESRGGVLEGVQVETLTPEIAQQLNLPSSTKGVVITSVDPASAAADAGLRRGDVIQEVNRKAVTNPREFENAVGNAGKQPMLLLVNRGGTTSFVVIESH